MFSSLEQLCHSLQTTEFFISDPAPPRSLFAVNTTYSSVTLLWSEEGVVDYYQVVCRSSAAGKELKVKQERSGPEDGAAEDAENINSC